MDLQGSGKKRWSVLVVMPSGGNGGFEHSGIGQEVFYVVQYQAESIKYLAGQRRNSPAHLSHAPTSAGIASQVRPSNSRPARFLRTPPHCLKKKGT
jgi:hypothetical protein